MNNKDTGFLGENITAEYLTQNGFEILHRNWRYKHLEIDIIAYKDGILHIVEVKTRTDNQFGFPEQAITSKKMQFLKNAAAHYQYEHPQWKYIQFDVAALLLTPLNKWDLLFITDVYF
jgi:putative endonuclease